MTRIQKFLVCMRQQGVPPVVAVVLWKLVGRSRPSTPQLAGGGDSTELRALRNTKFSDEGIQAWIDYCLRQTALTEFTAPTVTPTMDDVEKTVERVTQLFNKNHPRAGSRKAARAAEHRQSQTSKPNTEQPEPRKQQKREKKVDDFTAADEEQLQQCINRDAATRAEIDKKIRKEKEEIEKLLSDSFEKTLEEIRTTEGSVSKFLELKTVDDLKTHPKTEAALTSVKSTLQAKVQTIKKLNRSKWTVPVESDRLDNTKSFNAVIHLLVHSPKIVKHVLTSQSTDAQPILKVLTLIILRLKCFQTNELNHYVDNLAKPWAVNTPGELLTAVAAGIAPNRTTTVRYLTLDTERIQQLINEGPDIIFAVGSKNWATELGEKYLLRGGITSTPQYTTTVFSATHKTIFSGTSSRTEPIKPSNSTTYDLALYERA